MTSLSGRAARGADHEIGIVAHERPAHRDIEVLPVLGELPPVDVPARDLPVVDARVRVQVARVLRLPARGEIRGRPHDGDALFLADADRDHLAVERLAEADARVEPLRDDVREPVLDRHVDADRRVGRDERSSWIMKRSLTPHADSPRFSAQRRDVGSPSKAEERDP
ncbi:hypothetical protein WMF19_03775 [Sorangium sp. So ce124]